MKLLEFKENIITNLRILAANMVYTFQQDTAYWANNWGNIVSAGFFMLSAVLFVDIIYANVDTLATYTKDQMLFFTFVGEVSFFFSWILVNNLMDLVRLVNKGDLDLILTKPVSSLFYITFRKVSLFSMIRDSIPSFSVIIFVINWQNLSFQTANIIIGAIILFLGIWASHCLHFLSALPVFWLGESDNILNFMTHLDYQIGRNVPYEGYPPSLRLIFITFLPFLLAAAYSTSVMLGKTNLWYALLLSLIVAITLSFIRQKLWKLALLNYTSASS